MTEAGRLRLAIDLDGAHRAPPAAGARGLGSLRCRDAGERIRGLAGLNVPDQVRDWVYSPDGPAASQPDPAAEFLRAPSRLSALRTSPSSRPAPNPRPR